MDISVKNLSKTYKTRTNNNIITGLFKPDYKFTHAVDNISFDVDAGEYVAFLGPNGAGKTTTTKMLTGLIYPTSGDIKVMGFTPFERKDAYLRQIGLVMGNKTGLSWDLTSAQSFELYQKIYQIDKTEFNKTVGELGDLLEVAKHVNTQVRKLSLGERMKLELIGAILHKPRVLFLDEPTIGLDITSKKNIRNFLKSLKNITKTTLLLTSHDMDDIEKVCDRVVVINHGKKIYDGSLTKLMSDFSDKKFIRFYFENGVPDGLASAISYAVVEKLESDFVTFGVKKDFQSKVIFDVVSLFNPSDIDILSVPLEDVIEDLYVK